MAETLRRRLARRISRIRRPVIIGVRLRRPITDPIEDHWTPPEETAVRLWACVEDPVYGSARRRS